VQLLVWLEMGSANQRATKMNREWRSEDVSFMSSYFQSQNYRTCII
jgi:hypothetical protein